MLLACTTATGIRAQSTGSAAESTHINFSAPQRPSAPALVRYGKWVALGGAAGLGIMAHSRNQDAEATYQALQDRCDGLPTACTVGAGGPYTDPVSEGLYTETRRLDRQASRLLIGAEVALAASAVGFVWELMHRQDLPPKIPFEPRVDAGISATRVGVTVRF
ncbi:MAG: hypothetical protein ABIQ41_08120 [Gemmatimonadales bacterium]